MASVLAVTIVLSFMVGRYSITPDIIGAILLSRIVDIPHFWTKEMETVVFNIRFPRILAAVLVGAALSASGAAYQGMFRNPMVSPGILGVSAGASFGAALGIRFYFSDVGIQLSAFVFGLAAVLLTYSIGVLAGKKGDTILIMILAGIIIGSLFSACVSIIKYMADPDNVLPAITYWLMGSLAAVNSRDVQMTFWPIVFGLAGLLLVRWNLNVMAFGDEEARALGVNTGKVRFIVITCATLVTASAVSISGIIGFVGLIVPHLARLLTGPNYKSLLPVAILLGSIFLLLVDNMSRSLLQLEIPLGILTSLIGCPVFMYLLLKSLKVRALG